MTNPRMELQYLGRPVGSLQQMLRTVGFGGADIPMVIPTGEFNEETVRSVKAFQKLHGLPATGEMDYETWKQLVEAFQQADQALSPAKPLRVIFQRDTCIHPGETNVQLYPYQAALCALGTVLDVPALSVTGVHDDASVAATRWLQERAAMPCDGMVTKSTWDAVSSLYPALLGDGGPAC